MSNQNRFEWDGDSSEHRLGESPCERCAHRTSCPVNEIPTETCRDFQDWAEAAQERE